MSTLGQGSKGGEETAVGGGQQQHSMGQISRLLGRPKCFSRREDEWHDWSLKFGTKAATLSDHASVWMSGALQHTAEITLDHPDETSARIFARQMYTICVRDAHWQSFEGRPITMAWKRGDYCMNGISRKRDQGVWLSRVKLLDGISEPRNSSCCARTTGRMRRWNTTEL